MSDVLAWLSVWSEVQMICIWSAWCHCHAIIFCFLLPAYPDCRGKDAMKWVSVCLIWLPSQCNSNENREYQRTDLHNVEFLYAIPVRLLSVCRLSVCLSSVTLVRPTQAVQIFRNISTAFGTLAIRWHPLKISRRSSQGNPSAGGVKHKRGSKI